MARVRGTVATMRNTFRLGRVCLGVTGLSFVALGVAACAAPNYPDRPDVSKAQQGWCAALAVSAGSDSSWDRMGDCKGAKMTGSPAYIASMTKCYAEQYEAAKSANDASADDRSLLIAGCRDKVLIGLPTSSAGVAEIGKAKCDRAVRCEKEVTFDNCKKAMLTAEPGALAMFTTVFNAEALHEVADCLSGGCEDNEEEAVSKCYAGVNERLLWTP